MISDDARFNDCLEILFSHQANGFGKVVVTYIWGFTGCDIGPGITYFDVDLDPMEHGGMYGFSGVWEFGRIFREILAGDSELLASRKILNDGFLANQLEMTIYPDRRVEMVWRFDQEMDRLELEKTKKYLNQQETVDAELELREYYEHKGRSRKIRGVLPETREEPSAQAPTSSNEPSSWSVPELFQAIVDTLVGAAPDGWTKLVIDGQVWLETDASGRALNNVSADFQAQMADGSVRQINPEQPIAAMNALTLLQKQLPNHEGKPWRRLRVVFESTGPMQVAYDFDQAGLWRPES